MKVPVSWLKDYVTFDLTPAELAERLTFTGTEVEGIETVGHEYPGIVAAEVTAVEPHPRADRLRLCRVNDGHSEIRVVCGADNFGVGSRVVLAKVGAVLPGGMAIKEARLRGEASFGMLCAEDELGLSDDHSGLMLLPPETASGTPLARIVGGPETVLELEITWNRGDCLSILGMAREVAAMLGTELRLPAVDFPETEEPVAGLARVDVLDPEGCPRYTGRVMTGVAIGPSPAWMQRRLSLCGVRPINNVVDITNYVMLECGQPLHAFDYDLLAEQRIVVRRARADETMTTLDGVARLLGEETLVIADARGAVAVAGVMGGVGSEIRASTSRVLLESACFGAEGICRTIARLGLSTESSHRYARGVDVEGADWCSRRAAALLQAHAGARVARGVVDAYPGRSARRQVTCRFQRCRDLLGVGLQAGQITGILGRLGLPVRAETAETCTVEVPGRRPDIEIEADLIEEVARIHGLDKIPAVEPVARPAGGADAERARAVRACRAHLIALGLSETMNYSFTSAPILDLFGSGADAASRVVLPNPVSADYAVLRDSLLPLMAMNLGANLAHQVETAAFFEMGRVFARQADRVAEEERVCLGLMGKPGVVGLDSRRTLAPDELFLAIKGVVEALGRTQRLEGLAFAVGSRAGLAAGWTASVSVAGRPCGWLGLVDEAVRRRYRMAAPVALAELTLDTLLDRAFAPPALKPIPAYPSVARDVAMVVEAQVTHGQVVDVIRRAAPRELTQIELFDIFTGEGIGQGQKSLAYSIVYRSLERTLTDDEANSYHDAIKNALRSELKAEIREG